MPSRCLAQPQVEALSPQPGALVQAQTVPHSPLQRQSGGNQAANRLSTDSSPSFGNRTLPIQAKLSFRGLSQELDPPVAAPGSGKPLPEPVLQKMESSFGADFSDVRIHEGQEAEGIGAIAYTRGHDIHFAPGKYNPGNRSSQALLGHELAHVVQQRANRVSLPQDQASPINSDFLLEQEADQLGKQAAQGRTVSLPKADKNVFTANSAPAAILPIQCMKEETKKRLGIGATYKQQKITKKYQEIQALIKQESQRPTPDQRKILKWNEKLRKLKEKSRKIGHSKQVQAELNYADKAFETSIEEGKEKLEAHKKQFPEPPKARHKENPYPGYINPNDLGSGYINPNDLGSGYINPNDLGSGYINPNDFGASYINARSASTGYDLLPDNANSGSISARSEPGYDLLPDNMNSGSVSVKNRPNEPIDSPYGVPLIKPLDDPFGAAIPISELEISNSLASSRISARRKPRLNEEEEDKQAPPEWWEEQPSQENDEPFPLPQKKQKSRRGSLSLSDNLRRLAEDIAAARESSQAEATKSSQPSISTSQTLLNETQEVDNKDLPRSALISENATGDDLAWLSDEELDKLSRLSKYKFLKQVDVRYKGEETGANWLATLSDERLSKLGIDRAKISNLKVLYKQGVERNDYELSFDEDGKIYQKGKPFDTTQSKKAASGEQAAIFTMNRNGKIYAGTQETGQFHHSSFLAAAAAAGAGEISVKQGVLKKITNQSGHYLPGKEQMVQVLQELRERGVSLIGVKLKFLTKDSKGLPTTSFEGLAQKWLDLDEQKTLLEAEPWSEMGTKRIFEKDVDPQKDEIEALGFIWSNTEKRWEDADGRLVKKNQLEKIRKIIDKGGAKRLEGLGAVFSEKEHQWQTPLEVELDLDQQLKVLEGKQIAKIDEKHRQMIAAQDEQMQIFAKLTQGNVEKTLEDAGLTWNEEYECWETPNLVELRLNVTDDLKTINQLLLRQIKLNDIKSLW